MSLRRMKLRQFPKYSQRCKLTLLLILFILFLQAMYHLNKTNHPDEEDIYARLKVEDIIKQKGYNFLGQKIPNDCPPSVPILVQNCCIHTMKGLSIRSSVYVLVLIFHCVPNVKITVLISLQIN